MIWFVREVLPRLRRRLDTRLTVVGVRPPAELAAPGIERLERVDDLAPLYDRARVFIAPIRFGAGLPYKLHHAAAHGLPVVCTSLLANQLGWRDELLIADEPDAFAERCVALHEDPSLWARLRQAALARVERDCSPRAFEENLLEALR
jgi:glycosyltransferase involved in cell wall biosynthesis